MKRQKDYSWPTTPLKSSSKRSPKKQKQLKTLINKLSEAASNNSSLSADINDLKENIKDLTNLE